MAEIRVESLYEADMVHPREYEAMRYCQKNSLYDWLAREAASLKMRVSGLSEAVLRQYPVSEYTAPRVERLYRTALERLRCRERYPLYIAFGYDLTATVMGSGEDGYLITLNSSCLEELEDAELQALLGQALGHILAGHVQNTELLGLLETGAAQIPLAGAFVGKQLWTYFSQWRIASQFTADRAALFACGSAAAVCSLLLKQNGLTGAEAARLPEQAVRTFGTEAGEKLGIYFVWLSQSLPVFGAIERIRELRRWTASEEFRKEYPAFYHRLRLESGEEAGNVGEARLLELHRRAQEGESAAMTELADLYLAGSGGADASPTAAVSLYRAAAYLGDAKAMYVLALCMERGVGGGTRDAALPERLYAASASRGFAAAKRRALYAVPGQPPQRLPELCKAFAGTAGGVCEVNRDQPGRPIAGGDSLAAVRNAFWMDAGEPVYAVEQVRGADGGVYGLAIAQTGLYGRAAAGSDAYFVSWEHFARDGLIRKELDDGIYFLCGDRPLLRSGKRLGGSVIELLLRLAAG